MHDRKGVVLALGDLVFIPARVTSVTTAPDYCNLVVTTVEPMPPSGLPSTLSINSRQVERQDEVEVATFSHDDQLLLGGASSVETIPTESEGKE